MKLEDLEGKGRHGLGKGGTISKTPCGVPSYKETQRMGRGGKKCEENNDQCVSCPCVI